MPVRCFTCKEPGHVAADCPELDNPDTRPRWCGICDPRTRLVTIDLASGTVKRCPDCHPTPVKPLAQHKRCSGCKMTIHEWDTNPCGMHSTPADAPDNRPPRTVISAIVEREMAAEDRSAVNAERLRNNPQDVA